MATPDAPRHVAGVNGRAPVRQDVEDHAAVIRSFLDKVRDIRKARLVQSSCFPWDFTLNLSDMEAWGRVHLEEMTTWLKRNPE